MGIRYLNHKAIIRCSHGGTVRLIPPPKRSHYIDGWPILTDVDLRKAPIIGCQQVGIGVKPCSKIVSIATGEASKIKVDGETPILRTLQAETDGSPPGVCTPLTDGNSNNETLFLTDYLLPQITALRKLIIDANRILPGCPHCQRKHDAAALVNKSQVDLRGAELAPVAEDVYNPWSSLSGWTRLKTFCDNKAGFFAALYKNDRDGSLVLAFRGTRSSVDGGMLPVDRDTDANQALGDPTRAYDDAARVANVISKDYPNAKIEFVGHSLGGGEVTAACLATGGKYQAYVYNPAELHQKTVERITSEYKTSRSGALMAGIHRFEVPLEVVDDLQKVDSVIAPVGGHFLGFADLDRGAPKSEYLPYVTWHPVYAHTMEGITQAFGKQLENDAKKISQVLECCRDEVGKGAAINSSA